MTPATETLFDNRLWRQARPALSILVPFKGDDPTPLLAALGREACDAELVILDDGSGDPALAARVRAAIADLPLPARFASLTTNEGRAKGRNRLVAHARARHLLFLDSDMLPDSRQFIGNWLDLVAGRDPAVAFGGFSLDQAPPQPAHDLHRAMAGHSDCLSAIDRAKTPEKIFTSNLLVRADVFAAEAFDETFTGWGWEDVEWGMRVAQRWPILHIENTATHLGLDSAATLADKYEQSVGNFSRVVASHHAAISRYPSYKVARALKRAPLRNFWRPLLKAYAVAQGPPIKTRAFALRLYRAALYADAV